MPGLFDSFPYDTRAMTENDWKLMMRYVRTTGILAATTTLDPVGESAVTAYSGLNLQIWPGEAWIEGFYFYYVEDPADPGNYTFAITPNVSGDPRIDLVVLQLNLTLNTIQYLTIEGTPDPSPVPPAPEQNDLIWELPIAEIAVADSAIVINPGDITDLRVRSVQASGGSAPTPVFAGGDICIVSRSTDQTIAAVTTDPISFDVAEHNSVLMWDIGDPTKVTVVTEGVYQCAFNASVSLASVIFTIVVNGTDVVMSSDGVIGQARLISLSVGDYIEVYGENTHPTLSSDVSFLAGYSPIFQVSQIA